MAEIKITERIIAKADLSPEERMVARVFYGLSSAGKRTKELVADFSPCEKSRILRRAKAKIKRYLAGDRAEG